MTALPQTVGDVRLGHLVSEEARAERSRELGRSCGIPESGLEEFVERMEVSWRREQLRRDEDLSDQERDLDETPAGLRRRCDALIADLLDQLLPFKGDVSDNYPVVKTGVAA